MVIDFRKDPLPLPDVIIEGETVERVSKYKYLGTVLDNKMTFNEHIDHIHKKCQPRIFLLQRLRNLGINSNILHTFYRSCIESVLTVSFVCWFGSLSVGNKRVLNDVVNVCSKVVGEKEPGLNELYERRVMQKAKEIVTDSSHVLNKHYELLPSGRRYRTFKLNARAQKSFIPRSVKLLNH